MMGWLSSEVVTVELVKVMSLLSDTGQRSSSVNSTHQGNLLQE